MTPQKVTYKCIKRYEGCLKQWIVDGFPLTKEPYQYDICANCYEKLCSEIREEMSDIDN